MSRSAWAFAVILAVVCVSGLIIAESPSVSSAELGLLVLDTPKAREGCLRSLRSEIAQWRDRSQGVPGILVDRVGHHLGPSSLSRASLPAHPAMTPGLGAGLGRHMWITRRRVEGWGET